MDWKSFIKETKTKFAILNKEIPDTFEGFNLMGKEAKKNGATEVDAMISKTRGLSVSIRNGKEETAQDRTDENQEGGPMTYKTELDPILITRGSANRVQKRQL